ncbi:site-specific DNA-methyltransferase [Staphylococcus epidermidis]|uniref:site-specific DNA-methyltransferase n=1 Tax=Staphylococcus epidermidis TaxID=1282 RepID=UPI0021A6C530|nr:site-specific DNA-methyltransferase [Staphylococcus epidermidis]MCT1763992.1 site-specific DNA-methyltransferase [Staphylococcus epidermidis]MCT1832151.1 site-specific DNA-methyltransferase [Staphylococcus epidermidis]
MNDLMKIYDNLESNYDVTYPENSNATYQSLLNYSNEGEKPRQSWYRYKEGYSLDLIKKIICDYKIEEEGVILDPFLGSGTTVMAANSLGKKGIGFEVNPFSFFLSKCKLSNYTNEQVNLFRTSFIKIINKAKLVNNQVSELPKLSISDKVFNKNIESFFMTIKYEINNADIDNEVKNLLLLGWLSTLEAISTYRKAGNGLKIRKTFKNVYDTIEKVEEILLKQYNKMYKDLKNDNNKYNVELYNNSALNLSKFIESESIEGVIFSPPYANAFDYTEIYKLELWFGGFVNEYKDLKYLRNNSLRSHLNGLTIKQNIDDVGLPTLYELDCLLELLISKDLWNKKIPLMLRLYFGQMYHLLEEVYKSLKPEGYCAIIVGNSSYGGIIFPTDLLLAKYAEKIGFEVDKIEVDRYIITSSQQYKLTSKMKKYLRESVVCLKKKK